MIAVKDYEVSFCPPHTKLKLILESNESVSMLLTPTQSLYIASTLTRFAANHADESGKATAAPTSGD